MKKIWVLFIFALVVTAAAQTTQLPQYEFKSTSSYQYTVTQHQYTVPVAAYDLQSPDTYKPQKMRKNEYDDEKPTNPAADPNWSPISGVVTPLLLFVFMYTVIIVIMNHTKH